MVLLVATVLTLMACRISPELDLSNTSGVLMELPKFLDRYIGQEIEVSAAERHILPDDTEFARKKYLSFSGSELVASIVLSGAQKRSIHRPEICLPAQGWTIGGGEVENVTLDNDTELSVMKLLLNREVQDGEKKRNLRSIFMYWFVGSDRTTPHHHERVVLTSWDRVVHNKVHRWAYVSVNSIVEEDFKRGGKNHDQTVDMLKEFIAEAVPKFQKAGI